MAVQQLFNSITDRLGASASVRNVYGEPITAGEKTIVPVAKVAFGFGGGSGRRPNGAGGQEEEGGGGGGGVSARPVGVVEISPQGTRFIAVNETKKLAAAVLAGFGAGLIWAWRSQRR